MPKMQRAENRRNPQILRGLCPVLAHKANQNMAESEGAMSALEKIFLNSRLEGSSESGQDRRNQTTRGNSNVAKKSS